MFQKRKEENGMGKLEDKVAVVTGGNSGIGLATAKEFRREGARVVITGRDARTLAEAAREIGGDVLALRSDASSLADIDELFDAVRERYGRVDVLFVNAGVGKFAPVEETDEALFDQIMDINFKGAYFTVKKALPLLADGASVILNTSVVAHVGFPGTSVYSASRPRSSRSCARSRQTSSRAAYASTPSAPAQSRRPSSARWGSRRRRLTRRRGASASRCL